MQNHHYDTNGFYTYSNDATAGTVAPLNAIRCELPTLAENECLQINADKTIFLIVPDFCGVEYYEQDGTKATCDTHGVELPAGVLLTPPPSDTYTTHDGVSWIYDQARAKAKCELALENYVQSFCGAGALVTVTVGDMSYTGIFRPEDKPVEYASGGSVYRDAVDASAAPVDMGDVWYTKNGSGDRVQIPITEALISKIMFSVKNWHVTCMRIYNEQVELMLVMPDVSTFDAEAVMVAALPSRNITVTQ